MSWFNFLKEIFSGTGVDDTAEGALIRVGGKHVQKTATLNANATTQSVNLFQITGTCKIIGLHGHITDDTVLTNMTNVHFDLWDGTTAIPLTRSTGAAFSGFNVGAFFGKVADRNNIIGFLDNVSAGFLETTLKDAYQQFFVIQKLSTNTYIRFTYTTTDAPIDAEIEVHCEWTDIDSGTITAV